MTAPLVPEDVDLRDFHYMPLDISRLLNSDLVAVASGEEFRAAVLLWCRSWHQVPAASLPNDERMLAHLAGFGRDIKGWRLVANVAMRGFVQCDDGRLYHPVIAEKAIEAADAKRRRKERTAKATEARKQPSPAPDVKRDELRDELRDGDRDGDRDEQRDDARNVHQGRGRGNIGEVVARARDPHLDLERQLRDAAGWQSEPAPKLAITGPIQALIDNGADLHLDVLPTVRAIAADAESRTSWKYFVKAIARARDQRIAAGSLKTNVQTAGNANGSTRQPPARDTFAILEQSLAEQRARATGEAGSGSAGSEDNRHALPGIRQGTA